VFTFRDEYADSVNLLETPQREVDIIIWLYLLVLLQTDLKCVCIYTHTCITQKYMDRNNSRSRILCTVYIVVYYYTHQQSAFVLKENKNYLFNLKHMHDQGNSL